MNRSSCPADEWAQRQSQSQQIPQPAPVSRTSINPGSTPMARPPAQQQSNSVPANSTTSGNVGSRASSFFSSFRKSSADVMDRAGGPPQAGANSYQGHAQTMGNPQRRPDAGWDEYGRPSSMVLANDTQRPQPQQSQTQGRTGRLVSPRMQSMQQSQSYSSVSSSSPPQTVGRRKSSLLKTIPVMDQGRVNSEIQSVVDLSVAHSNKVYSSGPLVRRIEKNADGSINSDARWVEVWAQLGGTTLSVWEMDAIKQASDEGRQVPPTYINVTDSLVQVLGSVIRAASFYGPEERRSNVITINTAGSNLILFACPSPQTLLSWATALRLAAWEKSRIEEIYTGHLFRLSMMEDGKFHEPESTLQKGKLEGWAKVRISGSTEWQRLWVVVSTSFLTSSIDSGRPASPSGSTKKNRLSSFLGGGKSSQSANGHGSLAAAGVPAIAMYPGNKPKDKKKVLFTTTKITQAFAVYPERPEVISQSALFKIEGTIKDERVYSSTNSRERSAEPREGYALIIPEVESGKQGSNEMIKWLIAVHDAFGLYGRPEGYSWNPRDPHSVFFTYPFGPYRDHLFLDRELAEIIDPSVHETSRVRALLTDILIRRMHGPATAPAPAPQQSDAAGHPQLPPLGFGEGGRTSSADRSALATIKEQSVTSADSHLNGATQKAALNPEAQRPVPSQSISGNPQSPTDLPYGRTPTSSTAEQHSPSPSSAKATFGPPLIPPLSTLPKSSDIGSESPRKPGTPSIASNNTPGPQSPPKLSFDVNQRSESPLSARNGVVARNEAGTNHSDVPNHQHIPSIPSLRTPSGNTTNPIEKPRVEQPAQPAQTVQPVHTVASSSSSQIAGSWAAPVGPPPPSAQVVPVDQNQPATPAVPAAAPSPTPVPEQSDPQLFEQEGALYLLSQMDDEPPETSPLREASSLPLPPRLAALERQRANSADEDIPPSPFATMSNAPSPFTSTGSVAARYNSQSPDVNSYANSIRPQGNGPWTSAIGNTSPGLSQTNPQISSSSSPRPSESVNMMQPTNRQHSLNMPITHSPLPMSTKSTEEQEDENHHADALAAFNFINSGEHISPVSKKPPAMLAPPNQGPFVPLSPSTSGSDSGREQQAPRSSFAPTAKSIERKTNVEAHQAAKQESRHKPGRAKAKTGKASRGAWGSSDEEEEEEEEEEEDEEDSGDEAAAATSKRQATKQPSIISPQPQPHPTHPNPMSELAHSGAHYGINDGRPGASRRLPAIPGQPGTIGRSPAPHSPGPYRPEPPRSLQGHASRPSSSDPHGYMKRPVEYDEFGQRPAHAETYSRQTTGRAEYSQAQTLPSRPMWSTVLDPNGEAPTRPNAKETFVTIEPNETMTMAFQPHGLLQAGMQDKQSRSAKQQEAHARETGASLVNVPPAPPPPQMGLVGAITAHQRDREREGGVGAALTERERDRRLAEERQRKYDELQRAQLENMNSGAMQQGFNPMMMNPMFGWGMPMMYPMGGVGMGWNPGMNPQQQQQQQQQYQMWAAQQAAQQAAMQAYQQAIISFSQAGSQVGSDVGDHQAGNPPVRAGSTSPMPGWGMPMGSPMMAPMVMPGMMGMPGMMPGYGMGGSGFMQPPSVSPQPGRSPIGDDNRFSFANTPHDSPQSRPNDTQSTPHT